MLKELLMWWISILSFVKKLKNPVSLNVLNFMKKFSMEELYPNIWVYLRILLSMPVCVTSGERFSKLKLIKTYLRSSVWQEQLSSLATLSIENTTAQNLSFSELVKSSTDMKAREVNFHWSIFVNTCFSTHTHYTFSIHNTVNFYRYIYLLILLCAH
jgi:hypothetical protein